MIRKLQLMTVLAAIIVIVALAVPSLAWAHEGHVHHAAVVEKAVPAASQAQAHKRAPAQAHENRALENHALENQALASAAAPAATRSIDFGSAGSATDCVGHCCGSAAGMTCCGAALAPDPFFDQPFRASVPLLIPPDLPTSGLPPEALPKPPKSCA
jgi:hypothetical protein